MVGEGHGTRSFDSDRSALRLPEFWLASAGLLFAVLGLGIVEGVLPLHLSSKLSQSGIGLLYATMSVVVAVASALAARLRPRQALGVALALIVVGVAVAGAGEHVPVWAGALAIAGVGIGLANTGSIGVLLEGVPMERIVTAMVVWSQLGIVGYFIGPLAGGFVAQASGYQAIGLVPLLGTIPVLILLMRVRRSPLTET
jgi:MFS family permease